MNDRLAVAIPAYNRAAVLRSNLDSMLPELRETGTPVYICDDSTDDLTRATVAEFAASYPQTYYVHNRPGLGHDRNCLATLSLPEAEYVWYLSDATRIHPGGLKRVLAAIASERPDFLAVTAKQRTKIELPTGRYLDPNRVLVALAWHLTLTGATIYQRRFLLDMQARYGHFVGTNFIQLGVLLQNLPQSAGGLYWINEEWVEAHLAKGDSYWKKTALKVFMKDWADFILSLGDDYTTRAKQKAIRSHSRRTGVLEWRAILELRRQGLLNVEEAHLYRDYWRLVTGVPAPIITALARCPLPRTRQ
ncbi:MAG: glycosyltransferase [Polyangiaceae bacterium]